jgi:hypothetical protein
MPCYSDDAALPWRSSAKQLNSINLFEMRSDCTRDHLSDEGRMIA